MPDIITVPPIFQTLSSMLSLIMDALVAVYFLCAFAGKKLTVPRVLIFGAGIAAFNLIFSFAPYGGVFLWLNQLTLFLWYFAFCIYILKEQRPFSAAAGMILWSVNALFLSFGILWANAQAYTFIRYNAVYIALIASFPLFYAVKFLVLRFIVKRYRGMTGKYLYLFMIPCVLYIALLTQDFLDVSNAMIIATINFEVIGKAVLILLTSAVCFFVTLTVFKKLCDYSVEEAQNAVLSEQVKTQKTYIQESKRRYEENRSLQHDIKNHLLVLSRLIQDDKKDETQAYLEKLQIAADDTALAVNSGNLVVDILLGEKLSQAIRAGIKVSHHVRIPSDTGIDDFDLCVIFSNALDNALAACEGLPESTIDVNAADKNRFLIVAIRNSCAMGIKIQKGTGLRNIHKIAEKYGGTAELEIQNGIAELSVLLCQKSL